MDDKQDRHRWTEVLAKLRQERDELALKIHLGRMEAAAEWEKLETTWHEFRARAAQGAIDESSVGVGFALELAAEELRKGYARIRKLLHE